MNVLGEPRRGWRGGNAGGEGSQEKGVILYAVTLATRMLAISGPSVCHWRPPAGPSTYTRHSAPRPGGPTPGSPAHPSSRGRCVDLPASAPAGPEGRRGTTRRATARSPRGGLGPGTHGPCGETGAGLGARGSADPCLPLGASCTGRERSGALGGAHRGSSLRSAGGRAGSSPVLVSTPARCPKYTLALNE